MAAVSFSIDTDRRPGKILYVVNEGIGRAPCGVAVATGDGARDIGVEPSRERHVRGLLVVQVPKPPRQALHEAQSAGRELIARGRDGELVELAVEAHEGDI